LDDGNHFADEIISHGLCVVSIPAKSHLKHREVRDVWAPGHPPKMTHEDHFTRGPALQALRAPVVKETHKSAPKHKPGGYYFLYWFRCPKCKAFFMVESAKRYFDTDPFPNVEAPLFCALDTAARSLLFPIRLRKSLLLPQVGRRQDCIHLYGRCCVGNPGPGGWAAVLIYGEHRREIVGADAATTNNRMEIMAAISALESLKEPCDVKLHSDSRYVIDGITKWIHRWKRRNWTRNGWKAKGRIRRAWSSTRTSGSA